MPRPHPQSQPGLTSPAGIALIGPGRVGQALGKLLRQAGFPVRFVAARRLERARRAARFIGCGRPTELADPRLADASIFLLTTSDNSLFPVADRLASLRQDWTGKVALHTCGSLPATVLKSLRRRGAAIGSLHPFQTVPDPGTGVRNLRGTFWGIEGDPAARAVARKWAKALKGEAFDVRPSRKTLYHLAAFLVCPTTVTLMDRAARLLRHAGVPARVARPMLSEFVAETSKNFAALGARRSLTGPASRGDWSTLVRHLQALRRHDPTLIPVYKALLRTQLRLAGRKPPPGLL